MKNESKSNSELSEDVKARQFMSLVVPNQRRIFAFIVGLVPNQVDAEDILQDTLAEMWTKFQDFRAGTDFAAWGVTIAKYKVFNFRKKYWGMKLQFNDDLVKILQIESNDRLNKIHYPLEALKKCVQKLSKCEKDLLKMRYEYDLTFQKISERIGRSAQGIYKTVGRIHARLVQCIRRTLAAEGRS